MKKLILRRVVTDFSLVRYFMSQRTEELTRGEVNSSTSGHGF